MSPLTQPEVANQQKRAFFVVKLLFFYWSETSTWLCCCNLKLNLCSAGEVVKVSGRACTWEKVLLWDGNWSGNFCWSWDVACTWDTGSPWDGNWIGDLGRAWDEARTCDEEQPFDKVRPLAEGCPSLLKVELDRGLAPELPALQDTFLGICKIWIFLLLTGVDFIIFFCALRPCAVPSASKKLLKKLGVGVGRKWIELSLWFAPRTQLLRNRPLVLALTLGDVPVPIELTDAIQ